MHARRSLVLAALSVAWITAMGVPYGQAQGPLARDEIIKRLGRNVKAMQVAPQALPDPGRAPDDAAEVEAMATLRELLPKLPRASFKLDFEYGSSTIKKEAVHTLTQLGEALSSADMRQFRFVVAGHVDAAEGRSKAATLSKQRAEAVRDYLVKTFAIARERLIIAGFGNDMPQEPSNPLSPANRRVEVINIGQ
jgi:outer membrane protein OmpA-like peptidoglycan-associated protein